MSLRVIDSHTGGEPTRLVVEGLPEITGNVHQRLATLRDEHDHVRRTLCLEPRGSEVAVGAALFPPSVPDFLADVVFFNNTGYLGMCGHGTIGIMATLAWQGRISPGQYRLNTVAGPVTADLIDANTVSFENIPSFRFRKDVEIVNGDDAVVRGDIAYGGNWFFLSSSAPAPIQPEEIRTLTSWSSLVMKTLWATGVTGENGARIDHVEVFGPPSSDRADSKNFVLCPGMQYDRSPCGTGTSAKLACLYEDGKLAEGQVWRQESIIGSIFEGTVVVRDGKIVPTIKGQAFVTGDTTIVTDPHDPLASGIELG